MKSFSVFSLPLIAVSVLLFITSFALSGEISFPTTHPSTAVSDTWSSGFDDLFKIYVWRNNGHVWIEIEPLSGYPMICGYWFTVVQNNIQLPETVCLERNIDDYFICEDLYVSTIFRMVKAGGGGGSGPPPSDVYDGRLDYVDDPEAFILYFRNANLHVYSLEIPAEITAPIADFTTDPITGFAPLTVNLVDKSTGQIDSWLWDFGDGSTSTDQHPFHTYLNSGTYTVSLTVTGLGGSDTETKTDYVTVKEHVSMPWIPLLLLDDE